MIEVKVRPNESLEDALRRFRRMVRKSGLMQQLRRRGHYEKPSDRRRRKERMAVRRKSEEEGAEERLRSTPRYTG